VSEHPASQDELRYESSDARAGALFRFSALLFLGVLLASGAALGVMTVLKNAIEHREPAVPPMGRRAPGQLPPEPRLQTNPPHELAGVRAEEDAALRSYGWVDRKAGIVHIDIDEAMKLLVQRGLPVSPPTRAAAAPTDASPAPRAEPSPETRP
jgi:hypothetical protein